MAPADHEPDGKTIPPTFDLARLEAEVIQWGIRHLCFGSDDPVADSVRLDFEAIFAKVRESIAPPVQADDAELIAIGDMARKSVSGDSFPAQAIRRLIDAILVNPRFSPTPKPVAIEERTITLPNGKTARAFRWDGKNIPGWMFDADLVDPEIRSDGELYIHGGEDELHSYTRVFVGWWLVEIELPSGRRQISMDKTDFAAFFGS